MGTKKFVTLLLIFFALFSMSLGGMGCGSSGGTSTSDNKDEEIDYDLSVAEYALGRIVIGYQGADNPKYVTKNISLDNKIGSADISWSSSSSAISSNGTVTRQDADTNVTLTATATYNEKSASRYFDLKVIKKRTRDNSKIETLPLETASSGNLSVTRNDSGDIQDIEGNYAKFDVENADDAIDAITVIKDELGISNPIQELEPAVITSDKYGAEYQFQQIHNGVKVFGRGLMASANAKNKGDFMHSNLLPSEVIAKADGKNDVGKTTAENAAKSAYTGDVEVDSERTEKVIYSIDDYENEPVYAYIVRVYGTSGDEYIDESIFLNSENSNIITQSSNSVQAYKVSAQGNNEYGESIPFSVDVDYDFMTHTMYDVDTRVKMYRVSRFHPTSYLDNNSWNSDLGIEILGIQIPTSQSFPDYGQDVTAYTNMIKIMKWWKEIFNRNSLDDNGMEVKVVTHCSYNLPPQMLETLIYNIWNKDKILGIWDNAEWHPIDKYIGIYDKNNDSYSEAVALDILAHETGHAVMQYETKWPIWGIPKMSGAISEGYADIFALLIDRYNYDEKNNAWTLNENESVSEKVWTFGESTGRSFRNFSIPNTLSEYSDDKDPHDNGTIIPYAAYLMAKKNLSWRKLGNIWYHSLRMGLNPLSNFQDVRRCVVWAAQKEECSDEELAIIKAAFDEVGIKGQEENYGTIYGTVTEISQDKKIPVEVVQVTAYEKRLVNGKIVPKIMTVRVTDEKGKYSFDIEAGNYHISFDKTFYKTESFDVSIKEDEDFPLNVTLQKGNSISGIVMSSADKELLSGVIVKLFDGTTTAGTPIMSTVTDIDPKGEYFFDLKDYESGDYTLNFSKDKYQETALTVKVDGQVKDLETYLVSIQGISGIAYTSPDKEILSDATVQIWKGSNNTEGTPLHTTVTDSDGKYTFDLTENGTGDYTMVFTKSGYQKATYTVSVSAGVTRLHEAYIEEEGEIPIDEAHFPDEYFRNYVKKNIDKNSDEMLNKTEIINTTSISMRRFERGGAYSLQGIEYLTYLQKIDCTRNQIVSLDVSQNTLLQDLVCDYNQIKILKTGNNSVLKRITCDTNPLEELDISKCVALEELRCSGNTLIDSTLTALDISNNVNLRYLSCNGLKLTTLDISNNVLLEELYCFRNQLSSLNASNNMALKQLDCYENQITTLSLKNCSSLKGLSCQNNQLTELDVSDCTALEFLDCSKNQITTLDLSHCTKEILKGYVSVDKTVTVIWSSKNSTSLAQSFSNANASDGLIILASLPPFTATRTSEYVFDVSLDKEIPEDSKLILLNESEDLNGVFISGNKILKISADFEAGQTYAPVVVAKSEETSENGGGGCNVGAVGFALMFVVIIAKRRVR